MSVPTLNTDGDMASLLERVVTRADGKTAKVWAVRWKGPDGKVVERQFASDRGLRAPKAQAQALLDELRRAEAGLRGEVVEAKSRRRGPQVAFRDVVDRYLAAREALKREKATRHDYQQALLGYVVPWLEARGWSNVKVIDVAVVRAFRDALVADEIKSIDTGKPLSLVSKRKLLVRFKAVLRQAVEDGVIPDIPGSTMSIETPSDMRTKIAEDRQDRVFQPAEVRTLLRAADALAVSTDRRLSKAWGKGGYRALVYLMAYSGLRISEALGLQFANLDLDLGVIKVCARISRYGEAGKVKSAAAVRTVDLHPAAIEAIKTYLVDAEMTGAALHAYLFSTVTGQPLPPANVHHRCWDRLVLQANAMAAAPGGKEAGLMPIRAEGRAWHGLRRWVNSFLVHRGVDRAQVRAAMGHESEAMTAHYTYVLDQL